MRFEYIHNLRGVAILLIVIGHSIAALNDISYLEYFRYAVRNSSVLFIMIGGFLFSAIAHKYSYKEYLISKSKIVLLPYVLMSIPAINIYMFKLKTNHAWVNMEDIYSSNIIYQYFYFMVTGAHLGPLWFVPIIFVFYLFFPVLNYLSINKRLYPAIAITAITATYIGRPYLNSDMFESFVYFLPAYLWGIYLHKNQNLIFKLKADSAILFCFMSFLCLLCYYLFGYGSQIDLALKIFLFTIMFSLFLQYGNTKNRMLNKLAQVSFFIFFIHGYFIGLLKDVANRGYINVEPIIGFLIFFSVTMLCSMLAYYLATLCLPKSKMFLIGVSKG